jgi:hypothetical protein
MNGFLIGVMVLGLWDGSASYAGNVMKDGTLTFTCSAPVFIDDSLLKYDANFATKKLCEEQRFPIEEGGKKNKNSNQPPYTQDNWNHVSRRVGLCSVKKVPINIEGDAELSEAVDQLQKTYSEYSAAELQVTEQLNENIRYLENDRNYNSSLIQVALDDDRDIKKFPKKSLSIQEIKKLLASGDVRASEIVANLKFDGSLNSCKLIKPQGTTDKCKVSADIEDSKAPLMIKDTKREAAQFKYNEAEKKYRDVVAKKSIEYCTKVDKRFCQPLASSGHKYSTESNIMVEKVSCVGPASNEIASSSYRLKKQQKQFIDDANRDSLASSSSSEEGTHELRVDNRLAE